MSSSQLTSRPRSRENADHYPKDGTYETQLAWVRDRGYPEDGTHEANLEWVRDNGQLPPYPSDGTAPEKKAWGRLSTAYLTDTSDTEWQGEDLTQPLLEFTVNRRSGEVVSLRLSRASSLALSGDRSGVSLSGGATRAAHPARAATRP